MINSGCRGAIDIALPLHVKGLGFDSRRRKLFFLFSWSFCFFKTCFHFLTGLKYTGRLIASSLSAFISKIINPQVSHRHPLICVVTQPPPPPRAPHTRCVTTQRTTALQMAKDRSEIASFLSSPHYCAWPMRFESPVQASCHRCVDREGLGRHRTGTEQEAN